MDSDVLADTSCTNLVLTTPSCTDPSFGLFTWKSVIYSATFWCCKPGELGYLTEGGSRGIEACGKPPLGVPSTMLGTAVGFRALRAPRQY